MKVVNLKGCIARKLGAILIACGLAVTGSVQASLLNTNLVVNPSFENVDTNVAGPFGSVLILDWQGSGFAYNYSQNYDNGGPLAGGGNYFFNGGATNSTPTTIFQDINVSSGDTGSTIGAGLGRYSLSAFFSSYLTQGDQGTVTARFLDASNVQLGTVQINDNDLSTWSLSSATGLVPVGTSTVRIESAAIGAVGAPDGYADLVDFRILAVPEPTAIAVWSLLGLAALPRLRCLGTARARTNSRAE